MQTLLGLQMKIHIEWEMYNTLNQSESNAELNFLVEITNFQPPSAPDARHQELMMLTDDVTHLF